MDDLEGMINGILSNPDEMKKIMDMAGKIMGGTPSDAPADSEPSDAPSLDNILSGLNLGDIGSLTSAAQSILSSGTVKKLLSSPVTQNIIAEATHPNNDKKALFEALKPWLSEERRRKLEKAIVFARVMRIAGAAAPLLKGG